MPPAFETLGSSRPDVPIVFTCEHASNLLPEWHAEPADHAALRDHWGWDVGAADLTRGLLAHVGGVAVLSRFSRLVCDPNRDPSDATFVVERIEDHALSWNRDLDDAERTRRAIDYYAPYHDEIDRVIAARRAQHAHIRLCSVHSFTPTYRGESRSVEVGVLFDAHEETAHALIERLRAAGLATEPNQPYSGYAGMMHAAHRHGRRHGIGYLEIEVRQDLIATRALAQALAARIAPALRAYATDPPTS